MRIREALTKAVQLFSEGENKSDSARLDAELLLCSALNKSKEFLYTWPETEIADETLLTFMTYCQRRAEGIPMAYLLKQRAFWTFDLKISADVLIPRPETELLVELTLEKLNAGKQLIADLGTGSGAIALALARERPEWQLVATDRSEKALSVASANAAELGIKNIEFREGSWCEALVQIDFDAMVSNPPYIAADDEHLQQGDLRFEPAMALVSAEQGLADIREIIVDAKAKLKQGGWLFLEHGYQQAAAVRNILTLNAYHDIETRRDLAGNERVTFAQYG